MTEVSTVEVVLETNASGVASASTQRPLSGRIVEIRFPLSATALTTGGTGDFTFINARTGSTVLAASNVSAPAEYHPAPALHTQAGSAAGTASVPGIAIDDYLFVTVAQAAASKAGTVFVTVEGRG